MLKFGLTFSRRRLSALDDIAYIDNLATCKQTALLVSRAHM